MPSKTRKHYQLWTNDKKVIGIMTRIQEHYPHLKTDSAILRQLILWFGEQEWEDFAVSKETTLNAQTERQIQTLFGTLDKLQSMIENGASMTQTRGAVDEMRNGIQKWGAFEDGIENAFEELDFEVDE